MRYLIAFATALLVAIIIQYLNDYLLKTPIDKFLHGWISCMAFYSAKEFYLFIKQNQ